MGIIADTEGNSHSPAFREVASSHAPAGGNSYREATIISPLPRFITSGSRRLTLRPPAFRCLPQGAANRVDVGK